VKEYAASNAVTHIKATVTHNEQAANANDGLPFIRPEKPE
jgi:hypothetical protein